MSASESRDAGKREPALAREPEDVILSLDAAEIATWTVDFRTGKASCSPRLRFIFGLPNDTPEWAPVEGYVNAVHAEDRDRVFAELRNSAAKSERFKVEFRVTGSDGEERWVLSRGTVSPDETGAPERLSGAIIDITDRRRAEEALRASEEKYRNLFDRIEEGFCIIDMIFDDQGRAQDFRYVEINPAFERLSGMSATEVRAGRSIREMYPDYEMAWVETYGRVAITGEPVTKTDYVVALERWFEVSAARAGGDGTTRVAVLFNNVTERKRAEEALRLSEEQRRLALEAAGIGSWNIDLRSLTLKSDERFRAIFGSSDPGMDYEAAFAIIHPDDQPQVREAVAAAARPVDPIPYAIEYRVVHPDGSIRWVAAKGGANFRQVGSSRDPISLDGTVIDISDRKQAEEERERLLAEVATEQERLRSLFKISPSAIAVIRGDDLTFEYANDAYHALVGRDAVVGKPLLKALPEIAGQGFPELLRRVMATGEPLSNLEAPALLQPKAEDTARTIYVNLLYQPIREADGTVSGVFVHAVDVTDQVLARNAIAQSEEVFRAVFEQAPDDAIVVMDADRNITAWNPAAERVLGWSSAEAIGQTADLIFTPEDRETGKPLQEAGTAAREGKAADERWHVRKDGSRFWGSGTMNSLHHADGTVRGFLKVFRDATERYETERRIRELNDVLETKVAQRTEELQAAVRESEGFNYSISHDLRAPLRAIGATAGILLEEVGPELAPDHRQLLERQRHNAKRLGVLIDELLRLSRLARVEVHREPLDMTGKTRRVIEELEVTCPIEVQEGMTASGDPGLVRTVLQNLIGNACKFSPAGTIVRVGETDGAFWVRDEGIGFDMAYATKLFLPFERLVTESEFPGTGIGLANVKRIVERHGGRVWAESEPGKGATFFFTLG